MPDQTTNPFDPSEATAVLAATPSVLRALLQGLPDDWLNFKEDAEAWTPRTVLLHYIHNDRTNWIPRARVILEEGGDHRFPPFQRLPDNREEEHAPVGELLDRFAELRRENLALLESWHLTPGDLTRQGVHPEFGAVTLGQLLATWVTHDLNHLGQIVGTLAKRNREAVGPWRVNLAILDR